MALPRYIPNDVVLELRNSYKELISSLTRLVTKFPPDSLTPEGGFYYGPTSIAYLFFALQTRFDFKVQNQTLETWFKAYLKVSTDALQSCGEPTIDDCGIIQDVMSNLALRAASSQDSTLAAQLCDFVAIVTREGASNEWLYGRAGYLYLLRLVKRSFLDDQEILDRICNTEEKVIQAILAVQRPFIWLGKNYVGPGHGTMGIITQIVLTNPSYATLLSPELKMLLNHQFESGNWPSILPPDNDERVQFCHGAPGIVLSLISIAEYFPDLEHDIKTAVLKGRIATKERGLLTKEPGLCHGISGNAIALEDRDCEHFLAFSTAESMERMAQANMLKMGTHPESLMAGEAGRAWSWAVVHGGLQKRLLGYNDI